MMCRFCTTVLWRILAIAVLSQLFCAATTTAALRVASINLCSDQYLVALAGRDQIASVTWLAADPTRSAEAGRAVGLAVNHGSAEEIAAEQPDLVLANSFSDPNVIDLVRRIGIQVLVLPSPSDFAGIIQNVRIVSAALAESPRGEAIVNEMAANLGPIAAPVANPPVVAVLEPGGYTQGGGSLIDEAITQAGGVSLARQMGLRGYSGLPLEKLVAASVDLVIEPGQWVHGASLEFAILGHPAFRRRFDRIPRLVLPTNLTDCPAPASARLIPLIRNALERNDGTGRE